MGYHRAGFDVFGVDIKRQPNYPFEFFQVDVMALDVALFGALWQFDAIHASPPCQAYTRSTGPARAAGKTYPDLVAGVRQLLEASGLPWVIENVPGAPLRADYRLCGCRFGLPGLRRERWFETSWSAFELQPPCLHMDATVTVSGHSEHGREYARRLAAGIPAPTAADRRAAMGIDWMTNAEMAQAIPPAYTEHVGRQLLAVVGGRVPDAA